jgi:cytochrome c
MGVDTPHQARLNDGAAQFGPWGRAGVRDRGGDITMKIFVVAAAVTVACAGSALAQDVAKGEASFHKCLPCHSIGPDAENKIGPELNGLDGRHSGTVANFSYSDANKNSGIVWSDATFKEYIKSPQAMVPGTKMIFAGISNPQEIDDLWAYVKQFDANGDIKK